MATATTDKFTWPTPPKRLLAAYLKERVSGDADAPHRGLPFIDGKGTVRVRPSDWIDWLTDQGMDAPKRESLQVLKDAGLVQRVYQLPKLDGYERRSFGLYTGKPPSGTARLPRRKVERKAPATGNGA